ncbi:ribosome silencing factor [Bernardetia sp. OM2101]|uniref:ribosome silencing factor n=1 Tax=Bernardetia sp. OM2101 TaxID=3344876 RepID=UPI0035D05DFE
MTQKQSVTSQMLSQAIVAGLQDRKGKSITLLDLRDVKNSIADFFIICTGTSDTHVDALKGSVEIETYKQYKQDPWHVEGRENRQWILMDYVDVVVHIFQGEKRERFGLEELWGDAKITQIPDLD